MNEHLERQRDTRRPFARSFEKKSSGAPPSSSSQLSNSIHTNYTLKINTHTHIQNKQTHVGIARSVVRRTSPSVSVANFSSEAAQGKEVEVVVPHMETTLEWVLPSPPPLHCFDEPPLYVLCTDDSECKWTNPGAAH